MRILLVVLLAAVPANAEKPLVVLVAGSAGHGYGAHEFRAGAELLASALGQPASPVRAEVHADGWPASSVLEAAAALVLYMDGGGGHPVLGRLEEIEPRIAAGMGLVALHYAVEVPAGVPGAAFGRWIGGFYESGWSTNPSWRAEVALDASHPVARGVEPFAAFDEWYFNIRFPDGGAPVRPIATALPDDEARADPTWPPFAAEHILAASGRRETLVWSTQRPDGGRGVGFTGGHFHWNWGNDDFRKLVLNAIVWAAGAPVPEAGVSSPTPGFAELAEGQDERQPWLFFDRDETIRQFGLTP